MSCKIPYIEQRFRDVNPSLADTLNTKYSQIWDSVIESELFKKEEDTGKYLMATTNISRLQEQQDFIDKVNQDNSVPEGASVIENLNGYVNVNVLNLPEVTGASTPAIKEGVEELFNENPELSTIGTPQQYSQYLDTIFPDSKVKDIVYHGTSNLERVRNEGFDKSKLKTGEGTNLQGAGFYFAKFKQVLSSYAKGEKGGFIQSLINVRNPLQEKNFPEFLKKELNETNVSIGNVIEVGEKVDKWLEKNNKDGVVWNQISSFKEGTLEQEIAREKLFGSAYNKNQKILDVEHYSVKEPEQIHILGSKQDIEGFKEFVNKQPKPKVNNVTVLEDVLSVESSDTVGKINNLINRGILDINCS